MKAAAPIDRFDVSSGRTRIGLSWSFRGRPRHVRLLRSREWFPAAPDDHHTGSFAAELVAEGLVTRATDDGLEPERDYYYSLFVPRRGGGWYDPVRIKAWTIEGRDTAEISGGRRRRAPAPRPWAAALAPAPFVIAYLAVLLVPRGLDYHLAVAAVMATVVVWRLLESSATELREFTRWLAVPVVMSAIVVAGILWFNVWWYALAGGTTVRFGLGWLVVPVAPFAMLGMWLAASRTIFPPLRDERGKRLLVLAGPPLAALLVPDVVLLALAVTGVVLWRQVRREARGRRADALAIDRAMARGAAGAPPHSPPSPSRQP